MLFPNIYKITCFSCLKTEINRAKLIDLSLVDDVDTPVEDFNIPKSKFRTNMLMQSQTRIQLFFQFADT